MTIRQSIVVLLLLCLPSIASAESLTRAERLNHVSTFNKVTDWFATQGQSEQSKAAILRNRKDARRLERLRKEQRKQAENIQRQNERRTSQYLESQNR